MADIHKYQTERNASKLTLEKSDPKRLTFRFTCQTDATLYEHLGDIYHALRQPDQARQAFQKAYSIKPSEQIQRKLNAPAAPATP